MSNKRINKYSFQQLYTYKHQLHSYDVIYTFHYSYNNKHSLQCHCKEQKRLNTIYYIHNINYITLGQAHNITTKFTNWSNAADTLLLQIYFTKQSHINTIYLLAADEHTVESFIQQLQELVPEKQFIVDDHVLSRTNGDTQPTNTVIDLTHSDTVLQSPVNTTINRNTLYVDYYTPSCITPCILHLDTTIQCIVLLSRYSTTEPAHTHIVLPIECITDIYLGIQQSSWFHATQQLHDNQCISIRTIYATVQLINLVFVNELQRQQLLRFVEQCTQLEHNTAPIYTYYSNDTTLPCRVHFDITNNEHKIQLIDLTDNVILSQSLHAIADVFIGKSDIHCIVCDERDDCCASVLFNSDPTTIHISADTAIQRQLLIDQLIDTLNTISMQIDTHTDKRNSVHLAISPRNSVISTLIPEPIVRQKSVHKGSPSFVAQQYSHTISSDIQYSMKLDPVEEKQGHTDIAQSTNNIHISNRTDDTHTDSILSLLKTPNSGTISNNSSFCTPTNKNNRALHVTPRQHYVSYIEHIDDSSHNMSTDDNTLHSNDTLSLLLEGVVCSKHSDSATKSVLLFFDELDGEFGSLCYCINTPAPTYIHDSNSTIPVQSIIQINIDQLIMTITSDTTHWSLQLFDHTTIQLIAEALVTLVQLTDKTVNRKTTNKVVRYIVE